MTNTELLVQPHGIERTKDKLAIVACADSHKQVERLFPDIDKYEVWGLNQLFVIYPKIQNYATRWFQIHHNEEWLNGNHNTIDWMEQVHPFPIYVRDRYVDKFPSAVPFPKHQMIEEFGRYYGSQIAWMLALAIYEEFKEIHLYGVHMATDDEYAMQKDGVEYYIGLARGRGISVFMPPTCDLLKTSFLYGFEDPSHLFKMIMAKIKEYEIEIKEIEVKRNMNRDKRNQVWGGLNLSYPTEEEKKKAKDQTYEMIVEDANLKAKLDQMKGAKVALNYLKKNWMFKWLGEQDNEI